MSTWKKSHASIVDAWALRIVDHVGPNRVGDGSILCRRRIAHARGRQAHTHRDKLAMDPVVAPGRILCREAQHHAHGPSGDSRSTRASVRIAPTASNQVSMPSEQRLGCTKNRPRCSVDTSPLSPASSARHLAQQTRLQSWSLYETRAP